MGWASFAARHRQHIWANKRRRGLRYELLQSLAFDGARPGLMGIEFACFARLAGASCATLAEIHIAPPTLTPANFDLSAWLPSASLRPTKRTATSQQRRPSLALWLWASWLRMQGSPTMSCFARTIRPSSSGCVLVGGACWRKRLAERVARGVQGGLSFYAVYSISLDRCMLFGAYIVGAVSALLLIGMRCADPLSFCR